MLISANIGKVIGISERCHMDVYIHTRTHAHTHTHHHYMLYQHVEHNWNMWIPGFGTEEIHKKSCATEAHKQVTILLTTARVTPPSYRG